jgi:hypothetical protein
LDGREGLTAANMPQIAQYAPKTPRITVRIAVLLIKKPTKSALTLPALAGSPALNWPAADVYPTFALSLGQYPHLTPAAVNK